MWCCGEDGSQLATHEQFSGRCHVVQWRVPVLQDHHEGLSSISFCLGQDVFDSLDHPFRQAVGLWVSWAAGDMFEILCIGKLGELFSGVLGTITADDNLWYSVAGEVCRQFMYYSFGGGGGELVHFKETAVIIYRDEVALAIPLLTPCNGREHACHMNACLIQTLGRWV